MTTLSFRVGEAEAQAVQAWADELGVDPSELLRDALHRQLVRLASGLWATARDAPPLSAQEQASTGAADWGREDDWADWAEAAR